MNEAAGSQGIYVKMGRIYTVVVGDKKSQARAIAGSCMHPGYWYFEDLKDRKQFLVATNNISEGDPLAH